MRVISTGRRTLTAEDLSRINLPEDHWRAKIQEVQVPARASIENYLTRFETMAQKGAGLWLRGPAGVGKSAIAALVAKEARARGFTAYWTTVFDLREAVINKTMYDESLSVVDRCKDADVLVLDNFLPADIGDRFVNLRYLEELLVGRGSRLKVTVLTSRLSSAELKDQASFVSAVEGYLVGIAVSGEDLRKKRGQELKAEVLGTTWSQPSKP
jgi:predicted ATPase